MKKILSLTFLLVTLVVISPAIVSAQSLFNPLPTTTASSTEEVRAQLRQLTELLRQIRIQILQLLRSQQQAARNGGNQANRGPSGSGNQGQRGGSPSSPIKQATSNGVPGSAGEHRPVPSDYYDPGPTGSPTPYNPGEIKKAIPPGAKKWVAKVTAYHGGPYSSLAEAREEGGGKGEVAPDKKQYPLKTLQCFLAKECFYVTIAVDLQLRSQGFPYGKVIRIPWFEQNYNKGECIPFTVEDSGGAFNGRGKNPPDKIDIAWNKWAARNFMKNLEAVDDNCGASSNFEKAPMSPQSSTQTNPNQIKYPDGSQYNISDDMLKAKDSSFAMAAINSNTALINGMSIDGESQLSTGLYGDKTVMIKKIADKQFNLYFK